MARFFVMMVLLLCGGCGIGFGGPYGTCRGAGFPDNLTGTLISLVRVDRQSGFTESVELGHAIDTCRSSSGNDPSIEANCAICATAVIRSVYSE